MNKKLKKLAREIVEGLVDCGAADQEPVQQYVAWTEKKLRPLMTELEEARKESTYLCNLNALKNECIAELGRSRFTPWFGAMFAPVLARMKVDVMHRDGSISVGQPAGNVVWYHLGRPEDVVAFALTVEGVRNDG
ncbi:TPA: hypothetical protein PCU81_002438 [Staphylococcus aureus]|nr:hypothetical protein [Staphylococcus aureus]